MIGWVRESPLTRVSFSVKPTSDLSFSWVARVAQSSLLARHLRIFKRQGLTELADEKKKSKSLI